jgi:hypothetical protein
MSEDCLRFDATPKQCRGSVTGTVMLAAVAVGLAALAHWRFGFGSVLQQWDIAVAAVCLILLWVSITLPRTFTELSPAGIRARGFTRLRDCPWPDVADIKVRPLRGTRAIIVTRRDRSRFRLAVPTDRGPFMSDVDFASKFGDIFRYWQDVTHQLKPS